MIKPKKQLGQHFLVNDSIAEKTANALENNDHPVLEIGPGKGRLTKILLEKYGTNLHVVEIDQESVTYLTENYPDLAKRIIADDFLETDLHSYFAGSVNIIGNFPYNISSQILFRVLACRNIIPQLVGMFQKEVAERVVAAPGSKTYGILSVLVQAYYDVKYLFTIQPGSFFPPPQVKSAVIQLTRNPREALNCNEKMFFRVVKMAFNQRRKTLRNSLKPLLQTVDKEKNIFNLRPEQLKPEDFEHICNLIDS